MANKLASKVSEAMRKRALGIRQAVENRAWDIGQGATPAERLEYDWLMQWAGEIEQAVVDEEKQEKQQPRRP